MPDINEMMQDLQAADSAGDAQLAQHIAGLIRAQQGQQNPNGQVNGERDLGPVGNSMIAAGVNFAHNIPLVGDLALTAGRMANRYLAGQPESWEQANNDVHQIVNSAQQTHPVSSAVGGAAGAVDAAVMAAPALEGTPVARLLAMRKAQPIANAARAAAAGAAYGGAQAGGEQVAGGHFQAAVPAAVGGAGVGAVTAPVAGVVGGAAARVLGGVASRTVAPLARALVSAAPDAASIPGVGAVAGLVKPLDSKAASALSKVFGESPADLQAAWTQHQQITGRVPTMAEMADYATGGHEQQSLIKGLAKDSVGLAGRLQQNAEQAALARSQVMQANFRPPTPSAPESGQVALPVSQPGNSSGEVANATTAQGDIDYPAARAFNFNIPTEESDALGGASPADHMASQIVPLAGLKTADKVRIMNGLKDGQLSGQDAQLIRSGLSRAQGVGSNYSPAVASALGDLDDLLAGPGNEEAHAALDRANANYAAGSQRAAGAAHGESILGSQSAPNFAAEAASKPNDNPNFVAGVKSGARAELANAVATPRGATSIAGRLATDDGLHQKISSVWGADTADSLRRLGIAESRTATTMKNLSSPPSATKDTTLKDAAQVASAIATHGIGWKAYHAAKVFAGLSMSPAVESKVADYLTNPRMAQQGINLLAKAGASAARIRQITLGAASAAGILGGTAVGDNYTESQQ